MKKILALLAVFASLTACAPYNNYYSKDPGYYPNDYNNYSENQATLYSHNYNQSLGSASYEDQALDNIAMMQQSAIPVNQVSQQTVYQELPQNPATQQQMQQPKPYYNPALATPPAAGARGVVGVGQTLDQMRLAAPVRTPNKVKEQGKLIIPHAWRMAHPSIGKGLELSNQQERLAINYALSSVTMEKPQEIKIAGAPVSIIALANASSANAQGFLCKNIYLLKANNAGIDKMHSKFCRHPNWNEWVLTSW